MGGRYLHYLVCLLSFVLQICCFGQVEGVEVGWKQNFIITKKRCFVRNFVCYVYRAERTLR